MGEEELLAGTMAIEWSSLNAGPLARRASQERNGLYFQSLVSHVSESKITWLHKLRHPICRTVTPARPPHTVVRSSWENVPDLL